MFALKSIHNRRWPEVDVEMQQDGRSDKLKDDSNSESADVEDVWKSLKSPDDADVAVGVGGEGLAMLGGAPNECLLAVFAVLCWGSMLLQPRLPRDVIAAAPSLKIQQLPADHQGLKMDFVHRPVPAIFRNFQKALARRRFGGSHMINESTALFVSTINYHSLRTIGKVRLQWVENLSSHLEFNPRTRTLSVFRFPSFCALAIIAGDRGVLIEELVRTIFSREDETTNELECGLQLSQEVLMSYRLLFGQSRASRKLARSLLQKLGTNRDHDHLLAHLCTKSLKEVAKALPGEFWPISCRGFDNAVQEVDAYSFRDDFPMLGCRLAVIQEFNLRQQPSKLRDLWRDRRNPLQWYTFWAVLVVGGVSIILAILQLVVGIIQITYTN
ncbi:hypothetical protein F5Y03DRAFT_390044 [Xylaria venustula]|nr:hypothetical protein F5Y03DRAFT_390044 [Xylaria venustula]